MPALPRRDWTMQEVEELIEQRPGYMPRYELVEGELLVSLRSFYPLPTNNLTDVAATAPPSAR